MSLFQKSHTLMKWTRPLCGPASMSQNDVKTSETIPPQEASPVKHHISVLGIDIAKRVFHVVGMDERGQIVLRKRLSRHDLMPCIATLPPVLIGMEACGGAHYWARRFREHGHEVKLMAPQCELVASFPSRRRFSHAPRWRAPASYERGAARIMRAAPWQHMGENARARGVFLSTRS